MFQSKRGAKRISHGNVNNQLVSIQTFLSYFASVPCKIGSYCQMSAKVLASVCSRDLAVERLLSQELSMGAKPEGICGVTETRWGLPGVTR